MIVGEKDAPELLIPAPVKEATRPFSALRRYVNGYEKWTVVALFALIAAFPAVESVARACFKTRIPGAVLYTQYLTLWVGFFGALLATASGKHLSLATGELIPPGKPRIVSKIYVGALCAGVCLLLAYASWLMVKADSHIEDRLPGNIPIWWTEIVMPGVFCLMALRFAWRAAQGWLGKLSALLLAGGICALGMLGAHANALLLPGALVIGAGIFLGAPLFVAMSGLAMLLFFSDGTTIASVPVETFRLVANPTLPAVPLLTAAGYVFAEGGASRRLLRLARALIGWAPGAMALMVVLLCTGFTTVTGGSGVTILALGGLVMPLLVSEKYPEGFSLGLVTSAGSLGLLFFPSLPVILYAVVAKASPTELYQAGFWPGMLLVALVVAWGMVVGIRQKAPRQAFDFKEALAAIWEAKWEIMAPVALYILYRLGLTTIVETAALALVAAIVTQSWLSADLHWHRELPTTLARAGALVGAVLILLGVAMGLTSYLVDAEIPAAVLAWTREHIHSRIAFLLVLNAVLLVLGSVLEIYSAIIILAPLLAPMAEAYGIDPLHLGVVFLANLELGFLFPPMGLNLILSSSRFNQPLVRLYRVALPFLVIMAAGVLLITYVPAMTTGMVKKQNLPAPTTAVPSE